MWVSDAGNWGVPGGALSGGACKRKDPPNSGSGSGDGDEGAPSEATDAPPGARRRGRSAGAEGKAPRPSM